MLEGAAEPILRARAGLRCELARLESLLGSLVRQNPVCHVLMTMPGIGRIVALTGGRNQSNERDVVGAITGAGDSGLRTALYQAVTVMLTHGASNWLKAWGLRLVVLRGKEWTTIALPRRIGVALHRMWQDGTDLRYTRKKAMTLRTAWLDDRQQSSSDAGLPDGRADLREVRRRNGI